MPAFETGRHGRIELSLPRTKWPDLERAVLKYQQLQLEKKATRSRIGNAVAQKERLIEQHKRNLTKWLTSGKKGKEPVLTGIEKLDKEIEASNFRLEAIENALDESEAGLIDAVDEHHDEWASEAEESYEEALAAYAEVVETLAAARAEVSARYSLLHWVRNFPEEASSFRVRGSFVARLRAQNGDPFTFHEVMEALREDTQPIQAAVPIVWGAAATQAIAEAAGQNA